MFLHDCCYDEPLKFMSKWKSKPRTDLCVAPKNKARNTEIHQELKYFVEKVTGLTGVFKCALFSQLHCGVLVYLPPVLT